MKFSIAMTTYNGAQYVGAQLESIAAQSRLPEELVACDDRSSDQTVKAIEEFASSAPFPVRIHVNQNRLGATKNLEKALGLCKSELIALCDQDDIWHSEKIELLNSLFLSAPQVGLVFTNADLVDEELRPMGLSLWRAVGFDSRKQKLVTHGRALEVLLTRNVVTGSTVAFRSRFRGQILPFPIGGPLIHDGWIALIIAAIAEVAIIDKPLIRYRQHPAQQMGARRGSTVQSVIKAQKTAPDFYLAQAEQFQQACERLAANNGHSASDWVLSLMREKISHLHARAAMPTRRLKRVPVVLREVFNLHYHRFSRGWFSAAKDLLT